MDSAWPFVEWDFTETEDAFVRIDWEGGSGGADSTEKAGRVPRGLTPRVNAVIILNKFKRFEL